MFQVAAVGGGGTIGHQEGRPAHQQQEAHKEAERRAQAREYRRKKSIK